MRICIEFDNTLVRDDHDYDDVTTDFTALPGALMAVTALQTAGHTLILWSERSNRAARFAPWLDPLEPEEQDELLDGGPDYTAIEARQRVCELERQRYAHMVRWVEWMLPGMFTIDDGVQGKPRAELYVDARGVRCGRERFSLDWPMIARTWGDEAAPIVFHEVESGA